MKLEESLPILLGIFIGLGATLSLQYFINYPAGPWFLFSSGVVILAIIFIVYISDNKPVEGEYSSRIGNWINSLTLTSVFLISFIPFSIQKLFKLKNENPLMDSSSSLWSGPFQLPKNMFCLHLILAGVSMIVLAIIENKKKIWKRWLFGTIGALIGLTGGVLFFINIEGTV